MVCSSLARSELGGQKEVLSNGAANLRTEAGHHQGPVSNGIAKGIVPPPAKASQMVTPAVATPSNDILPKVPFVPENGDSKQKMEKEM